MYRVCLEYVFKCKVVSDEEGKSLQLLCHRDTEENGVNKMERLHCGGQQREELASWNGRGQK